jgi:U3 small nucleolar RNA-associated protein 15
MDGQEEVGEYRRLHIPQYAPRAMRETAESRYWRRFTKPRLLPQVSGVTHIDVCQSSPHQFAATSSTRVRLRAL